MNILILSWRGIGHPNAGGAEISTYEHAKGWVKAGHKVTLFTSSYLGCKTEERKDGLRIKRSGNQVFGVHLEAFKWYVSQREEKFDLVIDQFHGIPFFTPLFVKEKKLAFIHEVAKEVWSLNPWPWPFNLIPKIIGSTLEHLVFKLFYKKIPFITVSQSTKKDLIEWGILSNNITVIHNGLEKMQSKIVLSKDKHNILVFLGALAKDKGIEDALEIFAKINFQKADYTFWVIGKGDEKYTEFLKQKCKKLFFEKKIKFWGFVDKDKKFELLEKAKLLVNPSIREGWGLVVIEAASVGTPTVGYDVPGIRDSIINDKTGIIDKQNSVESITFQIMNLLNDHSRYQKMREEALKWSKKFSWDKSIRESLTLIESL